MILSGVFLCLNATHRRLVRANEDEEVLGVEAERLIVRDDLHMREMLDVGAHLVLALDDQSPVLSQDAPCFLARLEVEGKDGLVILRPAERSTAMRICLTKRRICPRTGQVRLGSAIKPFHVRWVKDNAIHAVISVRQAPTIYAVYDVASQQNVSALWDTFPECPFAVGHIRDDRARFDM